MRLENEHSYWTAEQRSSSSYFEGRTGPPAVETHNGERERALCTCEQNSQYRGKKRRADDHLSSSPKKEDANSTCIDLDASPV